jgi:hypothetical protein
MSSKDAFFLEVVSPVWFDFSIPLPVRPVKISITISIIKMFIAAIMQKKKPVSGKETGFFKSFILLNYLTASLKD